MHPIKSIEARYQSNTIKNFGNSKYAKRLRAFKNTHDGEYCFIVGNGPSLKAEDLEIIHKNKIPSFGFNRIFLYEYSFTCPHSGQKHTYLGYYIELCNIENQ